MGDPAADSSFAQQTVNLPYRRWPRPPPAAALPIMFR
jgi:hypothetical protein